MRQGALKENPISWWQPVLFAAMAGGLGWGIRGQYGHETGAMIAGVLVSLTLVFLLCPGIATIQVVRAAALGTVAMGIGGTETYGVTLGLCHNPDLVGNWAALRWGLLGCLIKGGLWIGFAGLFLGIGLGGKRYSPREMLLLGLAMIGASIFGSWLLNAPFNIEARQFSVINFSNVWYWVPNSKSEPRREAWGGLLFAMALGLAYTAGWKKDTLARNMGLWGLLGGAIGFPLGECLQSYHAWNPDVFTQGIWTSLDPFMNWWNNMETTFGFTMGGTLGLGLWLNRARIDVRPDPDEKQLPIALEWGLLALHGYLLIHVLFIGGVAAEYYDAGLVLALIPFVCNIRGRVWPWFQIFTVTLLPIAGKTIQELVIEHDVISPAAGWTLYFALPLLVATVAAVRMLTDSTYGKNSSLLIALALLLNVWTYFGLNFAYFRYPWPWAEWTARTPNGMVFTVFAIGLTLMVYLNRARPEPHPSAPN